MKMKKLLAAVVSATMLGSMLAACGGSNSQTSGSETSQSGEGGKTYQFWGTYEEDGENASMLNAAFLLNLNEDGTSVADKYMFANYDASDAATNPTYTTSYMSGTWKEVEKDGVECLQIKLAYVDDAGNESNAQTAYAYDVAGVYSFDLTFPVVPGMSYTRVASMEGKEGQTYADANAFIQAYKQEFTAPESVGTFTDATNNATAYLQADGTLLLYAGYDKFAEGKWALADGAISITLNDEVVDVTMDGNKATFTAERDMGEGNTTSFTFVCDDITALSAPEAGAQTPAETPAEAEGIATYEAGDLELVLLDDTNMKVKYPAYGMERDGFTYVLDGDTLTVTAPSEDVMGAFGQIWAGVGAEKWTISGNTATKAE
ncbi:hypothetical protein NE586_12450 [Gemmiger formicilis]|uniref:hypothetical protein n=1 Tax=Gemmiger TaxID=204475 RepID=UPI00210EFC4B|nr:hypothetical protein [Gemmiger formicilis]MCQ5080695.1 hypothetical protein [Gemmiger formicilis]MCQ5117278.1 hypothetical protein [Gemmiger formicilis]